MCTHEDNCVYDDGLGGSAQNSDGDTMDFDTQLLMQLEFIHCIIAKPDFQSIFASSLSELFFLTNGYMQITIEQVCILRAKLVFSNYFIFIVTFTNSSLQEELWASDPNEYVADEDDEQRTFNARISCIQLLHEILEIFGDISIKPFALVSAKHLQVRNLLSLCLCVCVCVCLSLALFCSFSLL